METQALVEEIPASMEEMVILTSMEAMEMVASMEAMEMVAIMEAVVLLAMEEMLAAEVVNSADLRALFLIKVLTPLQLSPDQYKSNLPSLTNSRAQIGTNLDLEDSVLSTTPLDLRFANVPDFSVTRPTATSSTIILFLFQKKVASVENEGIRHLQYPFCNLSTLSHVHVKKVKNFLATNIFHQKSSAGYLSD